MVATPSNALNISSAGLIKFDGTATFSSQTVTQYDVLVGGASNAISSVGPGTAGQVLQSGGNAANPAYSTATYPSTAGSNGNVLTSNGTNWVSSAPSSSGFTSTVIQAFTGSGTYTPTANMKYCIIEVIGGGGGGGGVVTGGAGTAAVGGGGGAGGYARSTFSAATIGASQSVTIGAGGTAGTNTGGTGGTGGTTSVGALISATGGVGGVGTGAAAGSVNAAGGAGGSGTGTVTITGASGSTGIGQNIPATNYFIITGFGANSYFGPGGANISTTAGAASNGNDGSQGGGGSGAYSNGNNGAKTGGVGGAGYVVITEFI